MDLEGGDGRGAGDDQGGGVLRPVTRASGDDLCAAKSSCRYGSNDCPDALRVARAAFQLHAQTGTTAPIVQQPGLLVGLGHDQIDAPIGIVIRHGAAALFAVNDNTRFLGAQRSESTFAVAQ